MTSRKILVSIGAAALMAGFFDVSIFARQYTGNQSGNQQVYFTFSAPVALPGVTLQAGRYEFRLANSLANREIVQIYSGDGSRMITTIQTLPAVRNDVPENAQISFLETPADMPRAIQTWWYPGTKTGGHEFIYSRQQAQLMAKAGVKSVLTTQEGKSNLVRLSPSGEEANNSGSVQNVGKTQPADLSAKTASATVAMAQPDAAISQAPRKALPHTASELPAIVWAGMALLMTGLGLGWRRRLVM